MTEHEHRDHDGAKETEEEHKDHNDEPALRQGAGTQES
jgi:hypothetical protein